MTQPRGKLAILISTFDKASDLWRPLQETYERFWPDNPYRVYLATNELDPNLPQITALRIGAETCWSDNVLRCLARIDEPYVLLTFEDLFLVGRVDTKRIERLLALALDRGMSYLGLHPSPRPTEPFDGDVGRLSERSLYRASTVWSLWKKEVLLDLLRPTESAWQFERNATLRSAADPAFYRVYVGPIPHVNGVVKGLWVPSVLDALLSMGCSIDERARRRMNSVESLMEHARTWRSTLFAHLVPRRLQHTVKGLFSRNEYRQQDWRDGN
jgi:hypothetical protein